jgi:hypothetical protein
LPKENKPSENKQENKQPMAPAKPVELSEEELGQITGGFNPQPDPPGIITPDGIIMDG